MGAQNGEVGHTPDLTVDFQNGGDGYLAAPQFTTADYYYGCVVLRTHGTSDGVWGGRPNLIYTSEASTAVCAEQKAEWEMRYTMNQYYGWPVCIVILRNNGVLLANGQILPIDAVNQGRSYLWRDVRPLIRYYYSTSPPPGDEPCT